MSALTHFKTSLSVVALFGLVSQSALAGGPLGVGRLLSDEIMGKISDDGLSTILKFEEDSSMISESFSIKTNPNAPHNPSRASFAAFLATLQTKDNGNSGNLKSLLVKADGNIENLSIPLPKIHTKSVDATLKIQASKTATVPTFILDRKFPSNASLEEEFSLKSIDGKLVRVQNRSIYHGGNEKEYEVFPGDDSRSLLYGKYKPTSDGFRSERDFMKIKLPDDVKGQIIGYRADAEGKRFTVQVLSDSKVSEYVLGADPISNPNKAHWDSIQSKVSVISSKTNLELKDFVAEEQDVIHGRSTVANFVGGMKVEGTNGSR